MRRPWRWIGHVMRGKPGNICCTALLWTPEGKQKRGWPKNTWHQTVEGEFKTLHHTWGTIQKLAQNRQEWGTFVAASHASRHEWVSESWGLDIQQTPLCVCGGGGISIIWHHTLLIRSHDHHNLTYHFELIATGTNLGRLEVSFWNKELWNGLGNQSELWMVDGCLWNPLINHSSHCQTVEQCSWQLWWSAKTDHNV